MLNNSLKDLHPDLIRVHGAGLIIYKTDNPDGPIITVNETSRSKAIQDAYFARSRESIAEVQRLYKAAGLYGIGPKEAAIKNSNARFGQSAHNFVPSRAFDARAEDRRGHYLGERKHYEPFWLACKEAADALDIDVTWGGAWRDWPHIELTRWRTLKH